MVQIHSAPSPNALSRSESARPNRFASRLQRWPNAPTSSTAATTERTDGSGKSRCV